MTAKQRQGLQSFSFVGGSLQSFLSLIFCAFVSRFYCVCDGTWKLDVFQCVLQITVLTHFSLNTSWRKLEMSSSLKSAKQKQSMWSEQKDFENEWLHTTWNPRFVRSTSFCTLCSIIFIMIHILRHDNSNYNEILGTFLSYFESK